LGLSIAKGLTELMNGKLSIVSEIDEGSTFTFTIPYERSENKQKVEAIELTPSKHGKIALLSENNNFFELMEIMLLPFEIELIQNIS
jgi:hypothetical protein